MRILRMIAEKLKKKKGDPQRSPDEQVKSEKELVNEWLRLYMSYMQGSSQVQHDTHEESKP